MCILFPDESGDCLWLMYSLYNCMHWTLTVWYGYMYSYTHTPKYTPQPPSSEWYVIWYTLKVHSILHLLYSVPHFLSKRTYSYCSSVRLCLFYLVETGGQPWILCVKLSFKQATTQICFIVYTKKRKWLTYTYFCEKILQRPFTHRESCSSVPCILFELLISKVVSGENNPRHSNFRRLWRTV